jgi:hypothetical protein
MEPPLFTQAFCHPMKVAGSKLADGNWEGCLKNESPTDCGSNTECVWNSGADLIPETDFCSPYFMTKNVTLIQECVNADKAVCSGQCKWRKGKVVDANTELVANADLFGANFCHPPTTENWNEAIGNCISEYNQASCE